MPILSIFLPLKRRMHKKTACGRPRARGGTLLLSVLLLLLIFPLPTHAEALSWYCTRAKNHAQPRADACFDFVEAHGGYYIDHRHSRPDDEDKVVYLTFDAGYENGNVARVLDTLRENEAPGAFFILGLLPEKHPDLVRRMADEGHLVCNHTYTHRNMCGASPETLGAELGRLEDACRAIGVTVSPYFRPPEGRFDCALLDAAGTLGYRTIFWSFAYADWDNQKQPDPDAARRKILDNVHNGAVLLLHPTSSTNAAILGDVIRELRAEGYRFGTLDELMENVEKGAPTPAQPESACETRGECG